MRKAICVLAVVCLAATMLFAFAAGDVDATKTYSTETRAKCSFVAFTTAATSAACDVGRTAPKNHTVQVVVTGGPAGGTIALLGSINGSTYASLSGAQTCTSSCTFHVDGRPVDSIEIQLAGDSGGTAPTWQATYEGVK